MNMKYFSRIVLGVLKKKPNADKGLNGNITNLKKNVFTLTCL